MLESIQHNQHHSKSHAQHHELIQKAHCHAYPIKITAAR